MGFTFIFVCIYIKNCDTYCVPRNITYVSIILMYSTFPKF